MRTALLVSTLVLASCQNYDFQPVAPLFYRNITVTKSEKAPRADVMVVIDRSGSMGFPIDPFNSACPNKCGDGVGTCPASCPTRISELRKAMPDFFNSAKNTARFGLSIFPQATTVAQQCVPSDASSVIETLPAEGPETTDNLALWSAQTDRISAYITNTLAVGGGTPTAQSLDFIGTTAGLAEEGALGRPRVILLLTDGLPNCRAPNIADTDLTSVDSVAGLAARGVKTMVIGFGSDANGQSVLSDMARAGGFARTCAAATATTDCGSDDFCGTDNVCGRAAYSAGNATELQAVLEKLRKRIGQPNPCSYELGSVEFSQVVVEFNGARLLEGADTWSVTDHTLTFTGASCNAINESTDAAPVKIGVGVY